MPPAVHARVCGVCNAQMVEVVQRHDASRMVQCLIARLLYLQGSFKAADSLTQAEAFGRPDSKRSTKLSVTLA